VDLTAVCLRAEVGMVDSTDVIFFDAQTQTIYRKDLGINWFTVWESSNEFPLNPTETVAK